MKQPKHIITLILLALLIIGCGEYTPDVVFEEPIQGRTINLTKKVGESFQVLRDEDTIYYSVSFDKTTDFNYLVKSDTDTVFEGTITKRNELYLLNRAYENGKIVIHALKFTDSTVTGLESEWWQNSIINNALDSGKYINLVTDTTDLTTLKAEKKDGKEIFRFVIDKLKPEKLILPE